MMGKNKLCAIINLTESAEALKPLTNSRPIAGLPFAARYRIIDFFLSSVRHADIQSVAMFIAESGRSIYDHVRSGAAWDLDSLVSGGIFTFSQQAWKMQHHQEDAVEDFYYNHRVFMARSKAEYVFVTGSKIIANIDIKAIQRAHVQSRADVTAVYRQIDKGFLGTDSNKGTAFVLDEARQLVDIQEREAVVTADKINANLRMFMISVAKLNDLIDQAVEADIYMEVDSLIEYYLREQQVNFYEYTGYAANIDSIQRYYQANMHMLERDKFNALLNTSHPILTKTKNGVPAYYAPQAQVSDSIIATGAHIAGKVHHSILYRRVKVDQDAQISHSILLQGSKVGAGAEIAYAIIDKGSVIEPGAKIIGSPEHIIVIERNRLVQAGQVIREE